MRQSSLSRLCCPACNQPFNIPTRGTSNAPINKGKLKCPCGAEFPIRDGIANLIHPTELLPSDEEFQRKYDEGADQYDVGLNWLFQSFNEDEETIRGRMCDLLELAPGARVLEIGCGTGKDSLHIAGRIGPSGELWLMEISLGMLVRARKRLTGRQPTTEYVLANASHLPFPDGTFDAVFHFGGLNTFGDIRRALAEMTRVTKCQGKIVVGDEGVAPWLRKKLYGRILANANPLYRHIPPMHLLPENAEDVSIQWILGNAFYLIAFRAGASAPKLNLDLPIPGKRGGTLRSRYYGV